MDNCSMIAKLQHAGVTFDTGLSIEEFDRIESIFKFHFPSEIKSFYACGLPIGGRFFNWRDLSSSNIENFHAFHKDMEQSFLFDFEHNFHDLQNMLGGKFSKMTDKEGFKRAVFDYLHQSTKLIPFYAHRCFFDGIDNMPIVSFWQPVDSIFYGENFEDYLEVEFLGKDHCINQIPEQIKDTGIWYYLIG